MEAVRRLEAKSQAISAETALWLCSATLVTMGLVLRARGFLWGTIPFWEDEAAWTAKLIDLPLTTPWIRPIGFMAASKVLIHFLAASETALRLLPWCAGVAALLMAPLAANRLFTSSAARVLFVGVLALHPGAIDLAKEFKPYSVGLALHMAYLLLALRYLENRKTRDLAALLALLLVGVLFAQDTLFAFPSVFGLLLFDTFRSRRFRHLALVALTAAATLGVIVTLYVTTWRKLVADGDGTTGYWGNKYDVFYVPDATQPTSRVAWTAKHVVDVLAMPGMRRETWHWPSLSAGRLSGLQSTDLFVWGALGLLGVAALAYRRRGRQALLLAAPVVVLTCFNVLGKWPLGAFRTDLFALVYAAGLAAAVFDTRRTQIRHWELAPVGALVVLPYLLFDRSIHSHKTSSMAGDSAFPAAMDRLEQMAAESLRLGERPMVALDAASCWPWRYYTKYHPDKVRAAEYKERFDAHCEKTPHHMAQLARKGLVSPEARAFFLLSNGNEMREVEEHLPKDMAIDAEAYVGRRDELVVRLRRRSTLVQ